MSNIEPGHVRVFQAVRSGLYDNITLSSCRIDGKPGVAIVMIEHVGEGKVGVMPLFVAIADGMKIEFEGENGPTDVVDEILGRRRPPTPPPSTKAGGDAS